MTQHTPTPWGTDGSYVVAKHGPTIADCFKSPSLESGECRANAAFIIKAANLFDAMLKALEEINSQAVCAGMADGEECFQMLQNCAEISDAILTKVKEADQC
jgi:hypothetical protein